MKRSRSILLSFMSLLIVSMMMLCGITASAASGLVVKEISDPTYYPGKDINLSILLDGKELTNTILQNYSYRIEEGSGYSLLEYAKIAKQSNGNLDLQFRAKRKDYNKPRDVELTVLLEGKNGYSDYSYNLTLEIAYGEREVIASKEYKVYPDEPTEVRFSDDISYCNIMFDGVGEYEAYFTRARNMDLTFNMEEIDSIVTANEDAELEFVEFEDRPEFNRKGTFFFDSYLDYLYEINEDGSLKYLGNDMEVTTAKLTRYCMSDEKLKSPSASGAVSSSGVSGNLAKPTGPSDTTDSSIHADISKDTVTKLKKAGSCYIWNMNADKNYYLAPKDLGTMKGYLSSSNGVAFRTLNSGGGTATQMIIKPHLKSNVSKNIQLGMYLSSPVTEELFNTWYSNTIEVFRTKHKGSYGIPVELSIWMNSNQFNTKTMRAYVYDPEKNAFEEIKNANVRFDDSGFVHVTTSVGGDIVITDRVMTSK